jgi:large subunit ribosomal protein L21
MYAVVETGGKQYKVAKNDTILVELMDAKEGKTVSLDKVLLTKEGNTIHVGTPYLKGASVTCEVLGGIRTDKVVAYKYKKRKSEKKKIGHRSDMLKLLVKEIETAKG